MDSLGVSIKILKAGPKTLKGRSALLLCRDVWAAPGQDPLNTALVGLFFLGEAFTTAGELYMHCCTGRPLHSLLGFAEI